MELYGKIIKALPPRTGTSASGKDWQCNTYVLQTQDAYPRHVAFDVFGAERIAQMGIQEGESLTVSFEIDAHEYQGRWYNSVRAFSVARPAAAQSFTGAAPGVPPVPPAPPVVGGGEAEDDLPF